MRRTFVRFLLVLVLGGLIAGCSKEEQTRSESEKKDTITERAAGAIKEYSHDRIDRARATQNLGNERVKAMDDALKDIDTTGANDNRAQNPE